MEVVAKQTMDNRGSEPYAGFYGDGSLNHRRIKYGQKFEILSIKTSPEEKKRREDKLKKLNGMGFTNQADKDAYVTYQHFGSWMTLDKKYKVVEPVKKVQKEPRRADQAEETDEVTDETETLEDEAGSVPDDLTSMDPKVAVQSAQGMDDKEILSKWLAAENPKDKKRAKVVEALKASLEK